VGVFSHFLDVSKLLDWYSENKREYFWRKTSDPYLILVAGVLLRKTTSKQVSSVFSAFVKTFPDIEALNSAPVRQIEESIHSLGIFRVRARQIKEMCKIIVEDYGGNVPNDYSCLTHLPGVNDYIANSVLCFAYNTQVAIVDTNILRIFRRHTSNSNLTLKQAKDLSASSLPSSNFKDYNWALLDLAAKVCKAKIPMCTACPLDTDCLYLKNLSIHNSENSNNK